MATAAMATPDDDATATVAAAAARTATAADAMETDIVPMCLCSTAAVDTAGIN